MAWSTPLTVATNDILSAAQYNQSVRDNLMETAPAKATGAGNMFTTIGKNQLTERVMTSASINTLEATSSSTYGDLDTIGPVVSLQCHSAVVFFSARMSNTNASGFKGAYASIEVSGATSVAASDARCTSVTGLASNNPMRVSGLFSFAGATDSRYTFTMKYRCQSAYPSAQFDMRNLTVYPF